jgi:hypothetical protein
LKIVVSELSFPVDPHVPPNSTSASRLADQRHRRPSGQAPKRTPPSPQSNKNPKKDTTLILEKDHGFVKYNMNRIFGPRARQTDVFEYYSERIENFINSETDTLILA